MPGQKIPQQSSSSSQLGGRQDSESAALLQKPTKLSRLAIQEARTCWFGRALQALVAAAIVSIGVYLVIQRIHRRPPSHGHGSAGNVLVRAEVGGTHHAGLLHH